MSPSTATSSALAGPEITTMEIPAWVLNAISAMGSAGGPIFAFLWWLERNERRELQKERNGLLERALTSIGAQTGIMGTMRESVQDMRGAIANMGQTLLSSERERQRRS